MYRARQPVEPLYSTHQAVRTGRHQTGLWVLRRQMYENCSRFRQHELAVAQDGHAPFRVHFLEFRLVRIGARTMMRDQLKLKWRADFLKYDVRRKR